ncbi:MAG: beta-lactamase family protein, partial [Deltaproteobacteria bacterium]|nr:beta-lactamase family protein [Deltaproteobacteria bacterium]
GLPIQTFAQEPTPQISPTTMNEINNFILSTQKESKIPGISLAIINGENDIQFRNYGYSSKKDNKEVTEHTLFEIGSTSKAFTGLGLLLLVQENKIALSDPVTKYMPWLKLSYENKEIEVTIEDFLYHKSGIPYRSIADIPVDDQPGAIERTVRTLIETELVFTPGSRFSYATINYDVLGLVIEKVSGITFEDYIRNEVLIPLGLKETYTNMENAMLTGKIATGYKMNFLQAREYNAPYYRGQVPAGYIVSSSTEISRWLQIQLGLIDVPEKFRKAIEESLKPDTTVKAGFDGSTYGAGWFIPGQSDRFINHGGANPNFSSSFSFNKSKNTGIVVLGNMDSSSIDYIGYGVREILKNNTPNQFYGDIFSFVDRISVLILAACSLIFISLIIILIILSRNIYSKKRVLVKKRGKIIIGLFVITFLLSLFAFFLINIPSLFFGGLDWRFVSIWGPESFSIAMLGLFLVVLEIVFIIFILLNYKKKKKK